MYQGMFQLDPRAGIVLMGFQRCSDSKVPTTDFHPLFSFLPQIWRYSIPKRTVFNTASETSSPRRPLSSLQTPSQMRFKYSSVVITTQIPHRKYIKDRLLVSCLKLQYSIPTAPHMAHLQVETCKIPTKLLTLTHVVIAQPCISLFSFSKFSKH